jgi:hypothetical protein
LRQSSAVILKRLKRRGLALLEARSCSSGDLQPELHDDRAALDELLLEVVDLAVRAHASPLSPQKPSTRSTSTRPYQERSKIAIGRAAARAPEAPEVGLARSSSVGAATGRRGRGARRAPA